MSGGALLTIVVLAGVWPFGRDRDKDDIAGTIKELDSAVVEVDRRRREGDRRGRIPTGRLDDQPDAGLLLLDQRCIPLIRDAEDVTGADDRADAPDGSLEERLVAEQRQEGFRPLRPGDGAEPRAAAAGQDDDVHLAPLLGQCTRGSQA